MFPRSSEPGKFNPEKSSSITTTKSRFTTGSLPQATLQSLLTGEFARSPRSRSSRASQDMTQAGGFPRRRRTFQPNPCCPDGAGPRVTKEQIFAFPLATQATARWAEERQRAGSILCPSFHEGRACSPDIRWKQLLRGLQMKGALKTRDVPKHVLRGLLDRLGNSTANVLLLFSDFS